MMPETAQILRGHVARNELANVEVVERALSDRDGDRITAHVAAGKFGQASIAGDGAGDIRVEVETATLAALLAGLERIALIKMDLEGAEVPALRGARPILDRVDAVIFETHTRNDEASEILRDAGFDIRPIDRRNALASRERPA
jgi:FkbM family methyltransferase